MKASPAVYAVALVLDEERACAAVPVVAAGTAFRRAEVGSSRPRPAAAPSCAQVSQSADWPHVDAMIEPDPPSTLPRGNLIFRRRCGRA